MYFVSEVHVYCTLNVHVVLHFSTMLSHTNVPTCTCILYFECTCSITL